MYDQCTFTDTYMRNEASFIALAPACVRQTSALFGLHAHAMEENTIP